MSASHSFVTRVKNSRFFWARRVKLTSVEKIANIVLFVINWHIISILEYYSTPFNTGCVIVSLKEYLWVYKFQLLSHLQKGYIAPVRRVIMNRNRPC